MEFLAILSAKGWIASNEDVVSAEKEEKFSRIIIEYSS